MSSYPVQRGWRRQIKDAVRPLVPPRFAYWARRKGLFDLVDGQGVGPRGGHQPYPVAATAFHEFGQLLLDETKRFLQSRGPLDEAKWSAVARGVRSGQTRFEYYTQMLGAFMPDYTDRLFEYYQSVQYIMLHRFLEYPFLEGFLAKRATPYVRGLSRLNDADVLDYGCGLPLGLLYALHRRAGTIRSITLVDLDVIHMELAEWMIRKWAPGCELTVHRLRDVDAAPKLAGGYSLIYAGDVFEHLRDPQPCLRNVLAGAGEQCLFYADLCEHEPSDQHLTRNTGHLRSVVAESGFAVDVEYQGLTEFSRGMAQDVASPVRRAA